MTRPPPDGGSDERGAVPPLFEPSSEKSSHEEPSRDEPLVGEPLPPPKRAPFEELPIEPLGGERPFGATPPAAGAASAEAVGPPEFFRTPLEEAGAEWWRTVVRWGAILLLASFAIALVLAWTAIQVTGEETGRRVIQRSLLPITEIDDVLDAEYGALVAEARLNPDPATINHRSHPPGARPPHRIQHNQELHEVVVHRPRRRLHHEHIPLPHVVPQPYEDVVVGEGENLRLPQRLLQIGTDACRQGPMGVAGEDRGPLQHQSAPQFSPAGPAKCVAECVADASISRLAHRASRSLDPSPLPPYTHS